jgi:hypothetical protein
MLKRREFFALVGGAIACPMGVCAQQQAGKVPRIGFLSLTSPSDRPPLLAAFRQRLRELGMLSSTIDMRRIGSTDCPTWRPSWSGSRWTSSSRRRGRK